MQACQPAPTSSLHDDKRNIRTYLQPSSSTCFGTRKARRAASGPSGQPQNLPRQPQHFSRQEKHGFTRLLIASHVEPASNQGSHQTTEAFTRPVLQRARNKHVPTQAIRHPNTIVACYENSAADGGAHLQWRTADGCRGDSITSTKQSQIWTYLQRSSNNHSGLWKLCRAAQGSSENSHTASEPSWTASECCRAAELSPAASEPT